MPLKTANRRRSRIKPEKDKGGKKSPLGAPKKKGSRRRKSKKK